MSTTPGGLKELHELHIRLQQVQEELERGPRQARARRQFAERKQAELEAQTAALREFRMAADRKSLQLKTNEAKIDDLRTKLNQAGSNREYDVIRSQIDADTMANSVLEDEILEALEKIDHAQIAVKRLEHETATARSEEQRVAAEVAAAEPDLKQQAAELESKLKAVEATQPRPLQDT
jgi:uncharacterized protein